ncbi:MAG: FecR protein [Acidimicrobiaceae bacterium]|jgi:uncharacterized cupin superfamily protein
MTRSTGLRALATAVVVTVAACGGGGGAKPADTGAAATLQIRDQAAELRAKAAAAFAAANDGQGLSLGDTVKTNGTGFAQVNYHDGSLTRLDANAQFTLTDLSTAAQAQRVVGTLDGGRAWSNVQKVTSSEGRYEVDTSVATASVRGTRFNTDCTAADGSCTFTVVEGVVTVTPQGGSPIDLGPGDSLTVRRDRTFTRNQPLSPDQLRQDAWIAKNLTIDTNEPRSRSSSSSASGAGTGAPLSVDACSLLTDAEVTAYANSIGGRYKVQPPVVASATRPFAGGPTTDPTRQHFCTWSFSQTTGDGTTDNGGTVDVKVERLPVDTVGEGCSLTNSTQVTGVGDHAEITADGALNCVRVGDVVVELGFGGSVENPTGPGDGIAATTLRQLATRVGTG